MRIEFAHPLCLALIPVCIVALFGMLWLDERVSHRGNDGHGKRKRRILSGRTAGELMLRALIFVLLLLSLSGISIQKQSKSTATVFLLDLSDSMMAVRADEIDFVRESISRLPEHNQAGIVAFGADARIEQFVSDKKVFTDAEAEVIGTATNLQQAVQTAMALFPDTSAKRLVILSDGAENEGSLSETAASVTAAGIECKLVRYENGVADEVYVSGVTLPETIGSGDRFQVRVSIYASEATGATVSLYSGRTLKDQREVNLEHGENQLVFTDEGVEDGLKSYRVMVEAEKDTVTVNNTYSAFTTVEAAPRLLVVEGETGESESFQSVLDACNYDYEVVSPSGVPNKIIDLLSYKSVILVDVYQDDLRRGFPDALSSYVRDYAGGLAVLGGPNSYALGNYRNTALEDILPVTMELEGEKQIPKLAMVMVIDHSGSMSSPSMLQGGTTKMDVAKMAATNALDSLRPIDDVGVLAFDDTYTWAVPIQPAEDPDSIAEGIAGISTMGGTSIYPAVEAAAKELDKSDATLRHIVLLTDGQDGYNGYAPLLAEMEAQDITLSTVAVGSDADSAMLQRLAEEGGGRYYYSDAGTSLPRIFAQEVYLSAQSYLVNEEFTPVVTNTHETIAAVFDEGSPSLLGYIATTPKPTATVVLQSHRKDPVLALWQCGLGRTIAWTSDGSGAWSGNFARWQGYPTLWRNLIDWMITNTEAGEDTLTATQEGSSAVLTYETKEYSNETKVTAVLTDEDGDQKEITLKASSPGVYEADVPLGETGVYSISLRKQQGDTIVKNINTATAMQYSKEYRYADSNPSLEEFCAQVDGRFIDEPKEVFDTILQGARARTALSDPLLLFALLLFFFDVLFRRLQLDWLAAAAGSIRKQTAAAVRRLVEVRERRKGRKQDGSVRKGEFAQRDEVISQESERQEESIKQSGFAQQNEAVRQDAIPGEFYQHAASQKETVSVPQPENTNSRFMDKRAAKAEEKRNRKEEKRQRTEKEKNPSGINTAALLAKKNDRELR